MSGADHCASCGYEYDFPDATAAPAVTCPACGAPTAADSPRADFLCDDLRFPGATADSSAGRRFGPGPARLPWDWWSVYCGLLICFWVSVLSFVLPVLYVLAVYLPASVTGQEVAEAAAHASDGLAIANVVFGIANLVGQIVCARGPREAGSRLVALGIGFTVLAVVALCVSLVPSAVLYCKIAVLVFSLAAFGCWMAFLRQLGWCLSANRFVDRAVTLNSSFWFFLSAGVTLFLMAFLAGVLQLPWLAWLVIFVFWLGVVAVFVWAGAYCYLLWWAAWLVAWRAPPIPDE